MSTTATAVRAGIRRGLTEFGISLRTPSEASYIAVGVVIVVVVLWLNRDAEIVPGLPAASFIVASILTIQLVFVACYGVAAVVSTEREDGTLLRARSLPTGVLAYVTGITAKTLAEFLTNVVITLVAAAILLGASLGLDWADVAVIAGMLVVGFVAMTTLGFALGAVFRNPRMVGGWGFVVVGALAWFSGLIQPLATMPQWAQVVGQATPLYWVGLGLRSAVLPDDFASLEIGGSWRLPLAFAVVTAWAIAGLLISPVLIRRVARRETVAGIEARRQAALQRA
ncbi:ABC transporter permease [Agromyces sp. NPDC056965]|uniref:ABC transporter permease n=1 Tax=Agromyces sp. NPDC056965 TaxID=3345983 RepID=UPI003640FB4E